MDKLIKVLENQAVQLFPLAKDLRVITLSHIISAAPPINSTTIAEAAPIKIAAQGIIC